MAQKNIDYLDYEIVTTDTVDNSFVIVKSHSKNDEKTYVIEVTSGSLQFCIGQAVGANSPIHALGSTFVFTSIKNTPIFYKAVGVGDSFIVGF